jgi:amino acid adenylation domain-containing protein/non-ribosomal peptide synthase protein (TIGR01720 family)
MIEVGGSARGGESLPDAEAREREIEAFVRAWHATLEDGAPELSHDEPLGLQSLAAADLSVLLEARLGLVVALEDLVSGMTLRELVEQLARPEAGSAAGPGALPELASHPDERHLPFELTETQQAYLVGRTDLFELGEIATHFYCELEGDDIDPERLNAAFARVIERHEMLRAVVLPDGRQQVLESVEPYRIKVRDMSELDPAAAEHLLGTVRDELAHQVLPSDRWPLFDVRANRLADGSTRVHFSIDLLIADAHSIMLVLRDWARAYADPHADLPPPGVSFRDYVQTRSAWIESPAYERAQSYWRERLTTIPAAPDLPLARHPAETAPRFRRRETVLGAPRWEALQQRAADLRVTPSALLCAAYADVLACWSADRRFTLNVTLDDRLPLHPDVGDLVGDFTSSLLLEVDFRGVPSFGGKLQRLQRQLTSDLEHRLCCGVAVQREMARTPDAAAPRMPVVFTSMLGGGLADPGELMRPLFDRVGYSISQTPQVYLDHQVMERDGELHVVWDCVEELFPEGMLDSMFAAYEARLAALADGDPSAWGPTLLPEAELAPRAEANATDEPIEEQLLHAGIERHVRERPDHLAVVADGRRLTYAELDERANRVAHRLRELGCRPNQLVAVVMEKGWEQIVAVLGIVRSGAAYLPIDAGLPEKRIHHLLDRGEARVVLTQSSVDARVGWPDGVEPLSIDRDGPWAHVEAGPLEPVATPADLAYVIFTSGSTGEPKGVVIEHRAAANTVVDCIQRFALTPEDRVLALSSLSFDLSVFDVFGALGAGATVVVPEPRALRDAARWAELVREEGVTVWNSVPALLDMLVEYADGRPSEIGASLRLAMLSGDWIPVDLPDRLRRLVPDCQAIGMGGATEGSIWSILYPIGEVDASWASIPYGFPMANQRFHVLDEELNPRPTWAPGELYIAGRGLAQGYWRDAEKTAERFFEHPRTGERLYRTGDMGRYLPDGNIEFCGREDQQVKIRGYRVELGEIEAALLDHPDIAAGVVVAHGERRGPKRLVAYCVSDRDDIGACDLRSFIGERLPEYMVPQTYVQLAQLPLTGNGKVDRKALPAPSWGDGAGAAPLSCAAGPSQAGAQPAPDRDAEHAIAAIWQEVLDLPSVGRDQDFFDMGGDSLLAMRVMAKSAAAGYRIDPDAFFAHPTIAAVAASAVAEGGPAPIEQGHVTGPAELTPTQEWFFEQDFADCHHWNGFWPLLSVNERLDPILVGAALHAVVVHHDALRSRFRRGDGRWHAEIVGPEAASPVPFSRVDLAELDEAAATVVIEWMSAERQASLDLENGPLLRLTYFDLGDGRAGRLHLAAHWAVLDYYSSRVFFEDLWTAYEQLREGRPVALAPKTTPFPEYAARLRERAQGEDIAAELPLWMEQAGVERLPVDHRRGPNDQASAQHVMLSVGFEETAALLEELPREHDCHPADALMAAIGRAVARWAGTESVVVEVEAHGRWPLVDGVDLSRTVGRCSTLTPYLLDADPDAEAPDALRGVLDQLGRYPRHGMGHGMLRYLSRDPSVRGNLAELPPPGVNFNYWGQADEYLLEAVMPLQETPGALQSGKGLRPRVLDVFGLVMSGQLMLFWTYSDNVHETATIEALAADAGRELVAMLGRDPDTADVEAVAVERDLFLEVIR